MAERAQPRHAQDKLAFLLSLVPYLMDHDRVSVAQAAAHFGVPEEQIREAVRLIGVSGIPGETTMYQDGDLFDIARGLRAGFERAAANLPSAPGGRHSVL
jgi:proteasome accessory factor C